MVPVDDPDIGAKVRETYERTGSLAATARSCGVGRDRVRRILGKPLPPSQTAAARREKNAEARAALAAVRAAEPPKTQKERKTMKTVSIQLTDVAYDRLSAIAETSYLSPDAFAALVVASYIAYEPAEITLTPREPYSGDDGEGELEDEAEGDEADEAEDEAEDEDENEDEDEEADGDEDEEPPPPPPPPPKKKSSSKPAATKPTASKPADPDPEPEPQRPDYSFIHPGKFAILEEGDNSSRVWVSQIKSRDGEVRGGADKVVVRRESGSLVEVMALELSPIEDD